MLVIRKEQMAVLERQTLKRFREKVRKHLRLELSEQTHTVPDPVLLSAIDDGLQRATRYGVTAERDVMLFIDLMFLQSLTFEDTPSMQWTKRILLNDGLDGEAKMGLIYSQLAAREQMMATR